MVAAAELAVAVVRRSLCEPGGTGLPCLGRWRGAALVWSLLLRLLSAGRGGVGGRWMRRATDMSN